MFDGSKKGRHGADEIAPRFSVECFNVSEQVPETIFNPSAAALAARCAFTPALLWTWDRGTDWIKQRVDADSQGHGESKEHVYRGIARLRVTLVTADFRFTDAS